MEIRFSPDSRAYADDARASAVAVFKLMQWLGKIELKIDATEWQAILKKEWGVDVSDGIAKYTIDKRTNKYFKSVVAFSFQYTQDNFPTWVGKRVVSDIYVPSKRANRTKSRQVVGA